MDDSEAADATVTSQLMKDPKVLAALQQKLGSMVGTPSGYIESLPEVVQRRVRALKGLQLETLNILSKFYLEVHELEQRYHKQYTALFDRRASVLQGSYEPTDAECDFRLKQDISDDLEQKARLENDQAAKLHDMDENTKGIPEFWLTVFKNVDIIAEMIQDHDEPILKHLIDVKLLLPGGLRFVLEFHFSANEFFSNSVLTKEYTMKCEPDKEDPFSFEGPEIVSCKGCTIDWKEGKNVVIKTVQKKQKHKSRGCTRIVTKTIQNDSFFNFFSPPAVPDDPEAELDDDVQSLLSSDFEIGHYFRERIVPCAVLYFTGEAVDDEDYDDEEEEEEDDDEENEESDPDFDPKKTTGTKRANPEECKQQ